MSDENRKPVRIAIFASGQGSNAQKIIDYFSSPAPISAPARAEVSLILSNKPGAGVLEIAKKEKIPSVVIEKEKFFRGDAYVDELKKRKIDFIVLAGFLWKLPAALIHAFPRKIINLHPALLPKYGGKGMYGSKVHEAVIAAKEAESGITIHYVDEIYDHGQIIFQAKCQVSENETPQSLEKKIHKLEWENFPKVIGELITMQNIVKNKN
jgi:phosphoribosylglycinamide formyltransferase 1